MDERTFDRTDQHASVIGLGTWQLGADWGDVDDRQAHAVLEAVGLLGAYEQAVGVVRPGGVISRVGVPQYEQAPIGLGSLFGPNVTLTGGPAPVRAYIEELLPAVLDGTVEPGRVFDRTVDLERTPDGYRMMDRRESLKTLIRL